MNAVLHEVCKLELQLGNCSASVDILFAFHGWCLDGQSICKVNESFMSHLVSKPQVDSMEQVSWYKSAGLESWYTIDIFGGIELVALLSPYAAGKKELQMLDY